MANIKRRTFLQGSIMAALAAQVRTTLAADDAPAVAAPADIISSPPSLQIPSPTSMGVVWGVKTRATGFVEVSTKADMSDPQTFHAGIGGLKALDEAALGVRLTGLNPNTRYYYRTGTIPIDFKGPYNIQPGEPVIGKTYAFNTPGPTADSSFSVINDTHEREEPFNLLAAKIKEFDPAVTVWNGDLCNAYNSIPQMTKILLNPGSEPFATERPFLYTPGNHDYRGVVARELPRFLLTREAIERSSAHAALDRNYAYRQGEIAMIGLDTGEDKPDWRKEWGQLAQFTPYRELQAHWLAEVLERPEIKSAPYIVVFCHIPIFDADPKSNPGDTATDFARWHRHCFELWGPLLHRYGVQVVITAHRHRYRHDAAATDRCWAHIVNGSGCDTPPKGQLTVLNGRVIGIRLRLTVHNLTDNSVLGSFSFDPRKV